MACGIYILYWNIDFPYIGQSTNVKLRKTKHLSELKQGTHCNYKLSNVYAEYGVPPTIEILEECASDRLNDLECFYIKEFDSINTGLNIISGGYSAGLGVENSNSKYSREQLLEVFTLLSDANNSYNSIAEVTGVHRSTVNQIARGVQHIWLKEMLPEIFQLIQSTYKFRASIVQTVQSRGRKYPKVVSPEGVVYTIHTNLTDFCKIHLLQDTNMYKLFKGITSQHKGWTVFNS